MTAAHRPAISPRSLLKPEWLWRVLGGGMLAIFALRFTYFLFLDRAEHDVGRVGERVFNEATGAIVGAIPIAAAFWLARRKPLRRPLERGTVPTLVASFFVISALHTTLMIVVRAWLAPMLGLPPYDYDFTASRYGYEAANDAIFFVAVVALLALTESVLAQRAREREAAALEQNLLRAELSNLRLQLQPHFLFNALNTISSTMYEDVAAADAQVGHLADLLRASLRTSQTHEVALREELQMLTPYVELQRARFGDALTIEISANHDTCDLRVPSLVLQPLVENAIRHGGVTRLGRGTVRVTARRMPNDMLELCVDDAPSAVHGVLDVDTAAGTGLGVTARRLRLLYGDAHALTAGATPDGGFAVTLRFPATSMPERGA